MNKDGKNIKQLTDTRYTDEDPCWSPDGRNIVFQSSRNGNFQIFKMKADGSSQQCLSNNKKYEYWLAWAKN